MVYGGSVSLVRKLRKVVKDHQLEKKARIAREIAERPPTYGIPVKKRPSEFRLGHRNSDDLEQWRCQNTSNGALAPTAPESDTRSLGSKVIRPSASTASFLQLNHMTPEELVPSETIRRFGLDRSEDADDEREKDHDRLSFRSRRPKLLAVSPAAASVGALTSPTRTMEAVWPGPLSPMHRTYRSLPLSAARRSAELLRLDGSSSSLPKRNYFDWASLGKEESHPEEINQPSVKTAEVVVDPLHAPGPRLVGTRAKKPEVIIIDPASWKAWGAQKGLGTPPPTDESPVIHQNSDTIFPELPPTGAGAFASEIQSPHTSFHLAPSPAQRLDQSSIPRTAQVSRSSSRLNTFTPRAARGSGPGTKSGSNASTSPPKGLEQLFQHLDANPEVGNSGGVDHPQPNTGIFSSPHSSAYASSVDLGVELHVPHPVVVVTIEDRPDPPSESTQLPSSDTTTAEQTQLPGLDTTMNAESTQLPDLNITTSAESTQFPASGTITTAEPTQLPSPDATVTAEYLSTTAAETVSTYTAESFPTPTAGSSSTPSSSNQYLTLTSSSGQSLSPETQVELDTLVRQLLEAARGLAGLAGRQEDTRGVVLVMLLAGFRV